MLELIAHCVHPVLPGIGWCCRCGADPRRPQHQPFPAVAVPAEACKASVRLPGRPAAYARVRACRVAS